jgi:POT family proton-dependent oligopeptide transporter
VTSSTTSHASSSGFFGQPRGLAPLFLTEAWERFSYYGMRAILLYYMYDKVSEGGLGIDADTARSLVAVYGAAVYMSAIAGGWVSDRILGARRSTLYGAFLIMAGHICLALPGGKAPLYLSMMFLVLGTGLLKPNISASVGDLYSADDIRRDSGFTIYYMGISCGALLAPLLVGTLGQKVNYHLGFSLAAIGMAIGIAVYVRGSRHLAEVSKRPSNPLLVGDIAVSRLFGVGAAIVAVVALIVALGLTGNISADGIVDTVSVLAIALPIAYFIVMFRSRKVTALERSRVVAYIPLFIAAVCFWIIQEQGAVVIAQYAEQSTDLTALGFAIPSSWFQSVGSFVLIVLTPFVAVLWIRLARRGRQPSTPAKFGIGLFAAGLSYALLILPASQSGLTNPLWLVASLALVTVGEMCLSPIGMSATTRLAPAAFATQTMGLWLASGAAGQGISAQIVQFYDRESAAEYFGVIGACAAALGALLVLVAPVIRKQMKGADVGDEAVGTKTGTDKVPVA